MPKINVPLNLRQFAVLSPGVSEDDVRAELHRMLDWMVEQQSLYFENELEGLVERMSVAPPTGSSNSAARKLGIVPSQNYDFQSYNMSEMFRTEVLNKTAGYLQNELLIIAILDCGPDADVKTVLDKFKELYPNHKKPTWQVVRLTLERLEKKGTLHSPPAPTARLPFSSCDTHYSRVELNDDLIVFQVKLAGLGVVGLLFHLPPAKRFRDGKITRPTVRLDRKGKLMFDFVVQYWSDPAPETTNTLGVDQGIVEMYVATAMTPTTKSAPYMMNRRVRKLQRRIKRLGKRVDGLYEKRKACLASGHDVKAEVLHTEAKRVRSKVSRLKVEAAYAMANHLCDLAQRSAAEIVFEDLRWVPQSTWDQARQQDITRHTAKRRGVRVRLKNPKDSSNKCSDCNSLNTRHIDRLIECNACGKVLDRDVSASRHQAHNFCFIPIAHMRQWSAMTRLSKPAAGYPVNPAYSVGSGDLSESVLLNRSHLRRRKRGRVRYTT